MPDTHIAGALAPSDLAGEIGQAFRPLPRPAPPPRPAAEPALTSLLSLDGAAFTEAAYLALLGRAADPSGAAYVAAELARGTSKLELLARLQASEEARAGGRRLAGVPSPRGSRLGRLKRLAARARRRTPTPMLEIETRLAATQASIAAVRRECEARLAQQEGVLDGAAQRIAALTAAAEATRQRHAADLANQDRLLTAMTERGERLASQFAETEQLVIAASVSLADDLRAQARQLEGIGEFSDPAEIAARIESAAAGTCTDLQARVAAAEATVERNRRELAAQQHRIGLMLHALRDRTPAAVQAEDDHALDDLYLAFEDRFRGTRADIKTRQRVYLPHLRAAGAGAAERPVLDIGAGRGEFLELLHEEGLVARGVDTSASMAAHCREAGFDCAQGDALDHLAAQPAGSLGALTGFHIVEHLPFKVVVRLLDEALRALAPGGLLVLETPNPANILVSSRWFHLDPTHRNPVPAEMLAMIAEARGFTGLDILPLHPMRERFPGSDRHLAEALDQIFHGPQDYALIGRRP
jgi:SAM-dependent methyltransferase